MEGWMDGELVLHLVTHFGVEQSDLWRQDPKQMDDGSASGHRDWPTAAAH